MATLTHAYSGSSAIGTTEFSFVTGSTTPGDSTLAGVVQVLVDCENMAYADLWAIRIKEKVITGATQRIVYEANVAKGQARIWIGPTLMLGIGWDVTIQKIVGTGTQTIDYSVRYMVT